MRLIRARFPSSRAAVCVVSCAAALSAACAGGAQRGDAAGWDDPRREQADRRILTLIEAQAWHGVLRIADSLEAAGAGGSVEVAVRRTDTALRITVEDDGPGFAPEYLADGLFRPFRTTKANGLGVGLVLCRSLAAAHGGSARAGNRPGGGASVYIELPVGDE